MTEKKRVVTRKKRSEVGSGFNFTKEMIPSFGDAEFMKSFQQKAWDAFQKMELPKRSEEAWRRTDLRKFSRQSFSILNGTAGKSADVEFILKSETVAGKVVINDGYTIIELDKELAEKGVIFSDLKTAIQDHPAEVEIALGQVVDSTEDIFSSMTAAFAGNGIFLYVPKGVEIEVPLQSKLTFSGSGTANFSHLVIWMEENSNATLIHEFSSEEESASMHSGIVEIHVGQAAKLDVIELQAFGKNIWNFTHERARIDKDGKLNWVYGSFGSHLTKSFINIDLVGSGAEGKMAGLYFSDSDQHFDHDTQQNHLAPDTYSDMIFKGALKDDSRSVWQGMIYVAPDAQRIDGYQSNPNLILDENARADSIPGLEILADDVRCSHGATIGKIDENEVFYIKSRGIPEEDAERLLVSGFFDPVIGKANKTEIKNKLHEMVLDKLER
jgi:Fe-S cluster assembly protein SufD